MTQEIFSDKGFTLMNFRNKKYKLKRYTFRGVIPNNYVHLKILP